MATFILTNNVRVGTTRHYAGELINDVAHDTSEFTRAGGVLVATGTPAIDAAAELARKLIAKGGAAESAEILEGLVGAAVAGKAADDIAGSVPLASVQTGQATLVAGTVTIGTAVITPNSVIVPIRDTPSLAAGQGAAGIGDLSISGVTPGAPGSFNIDSANVADVSTVRWLVLG